MSEPLWKQHFGNIVTGYDPVEAQGLSELGYALKSGLIPEDQYLVWARNTFGCLSLDMKFFQEQKAPRSLYEKLKESYSWSSECMPVAEWDEHLIIAGLEKPADLPPDLKAIFVFAPLSGLQGYWEVFQSEVPVLAEGEAPAEHEEASGLPDGFASLDSASTSLSFTGISLAGESKPAAPAAPAATAAPAAPAASPTPAAAKLMASAPPPSASEKPLLMKMDVEPAEEKPALVKAEPVVLSPKPAAEMPVAQAKPALPTAPPPPPPVATPAPVEKPKTTAAPADVAQDFPTLPPLPSLPPLPKIPAAPPTEDVVATIPSSLPKLPPSAPSEETPVPTHALPKLPPTAVSEVAAAPTPTPAAPTPAAALPKLPPTPPPAMAAPQEAFPEVKTVIATEVRAEPQIVVPLQPSAPRVEIPEALALETLEQFKNHYEKRVFIDFNSQAKTAKALYWPQDFVATEAPSAHSLESDSFLSIVMKTQKPYHGYLIKNPIVEKFFRELNQNEIPENVTVVPLICNDDVVGAVAGWGPKMTYNLNVLRDVQKAAHEMSVKLGWAFSDAA
ncbi:MAG: hypothetical protein ACK5Y2_07430 [Bdellovibrionales bacterium]